jgi:SAM-dependent methyltransferase
MPKTRLVKEDFVMVPPTNQQSAEMLLAMLRDLGVALPTRARILDFGCGGGELCGLLNDMGFDAYGVDMGPYWLENKELKSTDNFKVIEPNPYRVPFDDGFFDVILSTSVLEHIVEGLDGCFKEIHRTLKAGGCTLHTFPGRLPLPVEPHISVPLGSVIQTKWWLSLWALLGFRKSRAAASTMYSSGVFADHRKKTWREVAEFNKRYCETELKYLPRRELKRMIESVFGNVYYAKNEYLRHSPGGAAKLGRTLRMPGYAELISVCREQVVFMKKEELRDRRSV